MLSYLGNGGGGGGWDPWCIAPPRRLHGGLSTSCSYSEPVYFMAGVMSTENLKRKRKAGFVPNRRQNKGFRFSGGPRWMGA